MPPHASPLSASVFSLTRSQVLGFSTLLILPLLLRATLPWQSFLTGSLQSGWLWWSNALTRMVDIPGIGVSGALLLLTCYKLKLELALFIALGCALAALLASDWVLKNLIKHLIEEPRSYLLWLESQALILAIKSFYASSVDVRSEQVHAASQLLTLPEWLGHHWQKEVNYANPAPPRASGCCRCGPWGLACRAW